MVNALRSSEEIITLIHGSIDHLNDEKQFERLLLAGVFGALFNYFPFEGLIPGACQDVCNEKVACMANASLKTSTTTSSFLPCALGAIKNYKQTLENNAAVGER